MKPGTYDLIARICQGTGKPDRILSTPGRLRTVYGERRNDRQEIKVVNQPVGFRTFHSATRLIQVRNT
jgi:hypothetical protein